MLLQSCYLLNFQPFCLMHSPTSPFQKYYQDLLQDELQPSSPLPTSHQQDSHQQFLSYFEPAKPHSMLSPKRQPTRSQKKIKIIGIPFSYQKQSAIEPKFINPNLASNLKDENVQPPTCHQNELQDNSADQIIPLHLLLEIEDSLESENLLLSQELIKSSPEQLHHETDKETHIKKEEKPQIIIEEIIKQNIIKENIIKIQQNSECSIDPNTHQALNSNTENQPMPICSEEEIQKARRIIDDEQKSNAQMTPKEERLQQDQGQLQDYGQQEDRSRRLSLKECIFSHSVHPHSEQTVCLPKQAVQRVKPSPIPNQSQTIKSITSNQSYNYQIEKLISKCQTVKSQQIMPQSFYTQHHTENKLQSKPRMTAQNYYFSDQIFEKQETFSKAHSHSGFEMQIQKELSQKVARLEKIIRRLERVEQSSQGVILQKSWGEDKRLSEIRGNDKRSCQFVSGNVTSQTNALDSFSSARNHLESQDPNAYIGKRSSLPRQFPDHHSHSDRAKPHLSRSPFQVHQDSTLQDDSNLIHLPKQILQPFHIPIQSERICPITIKPITIKPITKSPSKFSKIKKMTSCESKNITNKQKGKANEHAHFAQINSSFLSDLFEFPIFNSYPLRSDSQQEVLEKGISIYNQLIDFKQARGHTTKSKQVKTLQLQFHSDCIHYLPKKYSRDHLICYFQGKVYFGGWVSNLVGEEGRQGFGYYLKPNKSIYEGEFSNDLRHGFGSIRCKSGEKYQGHWSHNNKSGYGILLNSHGDLFKGLFKDGHKNGYGEESLANGDFYRGEFQNGKLQGIGTYKWANGQIYTGLFHQGQIHQERLPPKPSQPKVQTEKKRNQAQRQQKVIIKEENRLKKRVEGAHLAERHSSRMKAQRHSSRIKASSQKKTQS